MENNKEDNSQGALYSGRDLIPSFQERCILDGTLTVNYDQVDTEYRLRHNDLLANIVHRCVVEIVTCHVSRVMYYVTEVVRNVEI